MLIVQPEAEIDIVEARRWYEARQAGVGDQLLVEIDRVFGLIERNPTGYAIQAFLRASLLTHKDIFICLCRAGGLGKR
jgi:hypothetical protein